MNSTGSSSSLAGSATRVLAVLGFVALIVIGMYGSVRVAQSVPGVFKTMAAAIVSITSIFIPANETITLSLPSHSVQSGSPLTIAFDHQNKKLAGTYAFRYACIDGVSISTIAGDGAVSAITCNQAYAFQPFNNSITATPTSEKLRYSDVELFVSFTPEGAGTSTVAGSTVVTVENTKLSTTSLTPGTSVTTPTVPETPKPKPTPAKTTIVVPQGRASDPNGYTDLTARIIEVGIIDSTGAFQASSTPNRQNRVAVRFAIENIGTKTANKEFTFSAVLPTYPPYTYFSPSQVALGPGDRIEYTIGFDSFDQDLTGEFIVNVDPTGGINEKDKANNIVKYSITVTK